MSNYRLIVEYYPWNMSLRDYKKFSTSTTWGNNLKELWDNFLKENDLDSELEICSLVRQKLEQFKLRAFIGNTEVNLDD